MLKRVYVEITNTCNLNCDFCHGTTREKRFMTVREFSQILNRLQGQTEYIYFHVLGEPLLHPELENFLKLSEEKGFRVCLTTNGTLLSRQSDILLKANSLHKISVSLHSFEGSHQEGKLSEYLDHIWPMVEALHKKGVICALRLWNEGGLEEKNGEIYSYIEGKVGTPIRELPKDNNGNIIIDEKLYLEMAERFEWPDPNAKEVDTQYCHAIKQQLAILVDGTVVPCCLDADGVIQLGNIFEESVESIFNKERTCAMVKGFENRHPTEALCQRCGYATRFSK